MPTETNINNLETFICNTLKDQIINLDLLPGVKLSEVKIANLYGCSRSPVRAAFYELRVKGFLDSKPQSGTFVSRIDLDRVEEIRFVRESVEIAVLRIGIENRLFLTKLPLLQANINEMVLAYEQKNMKRFTELDIMFHNILYAAAGKTFVSKYCGDDDVHYSRLRFMVTRDGANMQRTIDEHVQITEQIRSGSTKGVNELVSRHLNNIYNFLGRKDPVNAGMFTSGQF